jgi:hypothetical protein
MTYVFQAWPSWRYGPNGEAEIFESEDQVPEGWLDHPAKFDTNSPQARADAEAVAKRQEALQKEDEAANTLEALIDNFSQKELAEHLAAMQAENSSIEFAPTWPKVKLAQVILANGSNGPTKVE